jgi:hypothetical protein
LNQVAKHDWRSFFERRLQSLDPHAPLGGIEGGGWKLVYRDAPSAMQEARDAMRKYIDFRYSLGLLINDDGILRDVVKGSPASRAGVIPTMKLVAVNGRAYTPELLCEVIRSAKGRSEPIRLLTLRGEYYKIFDVGYHDGPKYPYLERVSSKPDVLDQIVEPLVGK